MKRLALLLILTFSTLWATTTILPDSITTDITLSDTVYMDSVTYVVNGATLTLDAGTTVLARSIHGALLCDNGTIFSLGTESAPVVIQGVDSVPRYNGILLGNTSEATVHEARFEHTTIRGAISGIFCPNMEGNPFKLTVTDSRFEDCQVYTLYASFCSLTVANTVITGAHSDTAEGNSFHALFAANSDVSMRNCSISGGKTGAIRIDQGSLTMDSCTISDISASQLGATGLYLNMVEGNSSVSNSQFTNITNTGFAGAISIFSAKAPITIDRCNILQNSGYYSGGIQCEYSDSLNILNCTINDNSTEMKGGGLYVSGTPNVQIQDSYFQRNSAVNGGGGLYHEKGRGLQVVSSYFYDNKVTGTYANGGAIELYYDTAAYFERVQCKGNIARKAGALFVGQTSGTMTRCYFAEQAYPLYFDLHQRFVVENSIFRDNTGFTISSNGSYDTLFVNNVTAYKNKIDLAAQTNSLMLVTNSIFWEPVDSVLADPFGYLPGLSFANCYTSDEQSEAPLFKNPDGGDYRLLEGSPCINAGDSTFVQADSDFWGLKRVVGDNVDIGAHEAALQTPIESQSFAAVKNAVTIVDSELQLHNFATEEVVVGLYSLDGRLLWKTELEQGVSAVAIPDSFAYGFYVLDVSSETKRHNLIVGL